jgi:hypothetical protein
MRKFIPIFILAYGTVAAFGQQQPTDRFEKVVNRMVETINKEDYAGTGKDFAQSMEDFLPLEKRRPFFKNLLAQYGKIRKLDMPRLISPGQAIFVAHCERGKLDMTVWLDEKDKITGLLFLPHKPDIPAPENTGGWFFGAEIPKNSTYITMLLIRNLLLISLV